MSLTLPMPSHRCLMPPATLNDRLTVSPPPRSILIAPAPLTDGMLNENAWGPPMCGSAMRLKTTRRSAFASVTVPIVERALAPIRSWSRMIAVVSPSSESTSGRASVGMKPWTKALYVSLISRCDSAAIVPKTSELLPEPETPVNTVSRRFGISTVTSLRLFTRAPWTRMSSWLSAAELLVIGRSCTCGALVDERPGASADVDVGHLDGVVPVSETVPRRDLGLHVAGGVGRPRPHAVPPGQVGVPLVGPVL